MKIEKTIQKVRGKDGNTDMKIHKKEKEEKEEHRRNEHNQRLEGILY